MKITMSQLRRLIREAVSAHLQDEGDVPGQPRYKHGEPLDPKDLDRLGPGIWGHELSEDDLEEEEEL